MAATCRSRLWLGNLDHQCLGGEQQAGNRSRILQGSPGYLGRVDDAGLHQVLEHASCRVVAEVLVLRLKNLGHHHCTLFAGIRDDLAQGLFE